MKRLRYYRKSNKESARTSLADTDHMNAAYDTDLFIIDQEGIILCNIRGEALFAPRTDDQIDIPEDNHPVVAKSLVKKALLVDSETWTRISVDSEEQTQVLCRKLHGQTLRVILLKTLRNDHGALSRFGTRSFTTAIHDLKNPMGAIYSYTEALVDPDFGFNLTGQPREIVEKIRRASIRVLDMLKNYESLFYMQRESNTRSAEVNYCIEEIVDTSSYLIRKDVSVSKDLASEDLFVPLSRFSLERVLGNLIINAFKYTEKQGKIRISTRRAGSSVIVEVVNSGPLIDKEDQEEIFSFRKRGKTTGDESGTGLGLYIARKLTETAGGSLVLNVSKEQGVVFTVTLPGSRL